MENLTLFQGDDAAIDEADMLKLLGIDEAVAKLAQGYSTKVHAGTSDASEGLLQRVGIARALLSRPRILILDEANNSLDREGDQHLAQLLMSLKGRITILLITQRPSLLNIADRRLELVTGKLLSGEAKPVDQLANTAAGTSSTTNDQPRLPGPEPI
jgi:ABC-type protease/lipase transport system fused ATPase/permease subunit